MYDHLDNNEGNNQCNFSHKYRHGKRGGMYGLGGFGPSVGPYLKDSAGGTSEFLVALMHISIRF